MSVAMAIGMPFFAHAQLPLFDPGGVKDIGSPLRGKAAVDVMPGVKRGLGYPLRYGNVIRGTVAVDVSGQSLKEGSDFDVDFASGVLYVKTEVKDSDSIRVRYRHDPDGKASSGGSALPLLTLNFGRQSSMTMLMGMGGAERFADGRIMQSQNIGMKNNFLVGNTNISGMYLVSSRSNALVAADGASPDGGQVTAGAEGTDSLIVQKATAALGSGTSFTAEYQRVDQGFAAFGALKSGGIAEETVNQLEKETGISRTGLGFSGGSPKGFSFTNSFRTIDDGRGKITFHNYGLKSSVFDLYFNSRRIENSFSRFEDIAETDRVQYQKERGIERSGFGGALRFGESSLKFDRTSISQEDDNGISTSNLSFDTPWLRAAFSTQEIDALFARAGDLAEGERDQWGKERGFKRKDMTFALPRGKDKVLASYAQKSVEFDGSALRSSTFSYGTKNLGLEFWNRSSAPGFLRFGDLTGPERDTVANQVLRMYDPTAAANENDKAWLDHEAGLSRSFLRFKGSPSKASSFTFETLGIDGENGGIKNDVLRVSAGSLKFDYRHMNIDPTFARVFDLLEAERNFYGNQIGFDKREWSLAGKLGAKTDFSLSQMGIDTEKGGVQRMKASVKGQGFEVNAGVRNIDSSFDRVFDINDPEKDLLSQLVGYQQKDLQLKFDAVKNFKIDALLYDADNGDEELHRYKNQASMSYAPDKFTQLAFNFNNHKLDGMAGLLYQNSVSSFRGTRNLGEIGQVSYMHEEEKFAGVEREKPDRKTDLIKYETNFMKSVSFMTEQVRTVFADAGYENVNSYKVGWQVTKKLGINVEQVEVARDKDKPDQEATNLGFSYDFGNNLKLGYTWHHDLDTVLGGKHNLKWELTNGSMGGFNMGGSFTENGVDGQRASTIGNFTLSNPKPFSLGIFKEAKINLGYDGETQLGVWQRERRLGEFSTKIFGSLFGLGYSHVLLPGQIIGADRFATFKLDPTGKKRLQMNLGYKVRTLPNGGNLVMQDFDLGYKVGDKFNLSHSTDNFPEQAENGSPLGTSARPTRARTWAIDYIPNTDTNFKFAFNDLEDIQQHTLARRANVTMSMFNKSGSPIRLTYGVEQSENPLDGRRTRHQYEFAFDQKPGPYQTFSFAVGSINWEHGIVEGQLWNRMMLNVDYQLRF